MGSWITGGVGLAGVATFAVFGSIAKSKANELDECLPHCPESLRSTADEGKRNQTIANIGLVVGGPRLTHRGLPQSDFAFSNPRIPKNAPSMWLLLPMDFCFVGLFTEASYAPTMTSRGFTTETQRT